VQQHNVLAHVRLVAHERVGTGFGLLIFSMEEILRGEGGGIGTRLLRIFRFSEEFGFFREVNGACSLNKSVNLSFKRVMQISRHNIIRSGNFLEFPSSADRFLEKF
jgi:hypothetical protein